MPICGESSPRGERDDRCGLVESSEQVGTWRVMDLDWDLEAGVAPKADQAGPMQQSTMPISNKIFQAFCTPAANTNTP